MKASDFKSTFEEIYKTTGCNDIWPTGWLVSAPNGDLFDIYLNFHFRLRNPDQPASASDICYPHYFTPSCIGADEYYFFNPLYPNYRLGPLEGSPCDTLTLEPPGEAPGEEWTLSVGPSPATSSFTVRLGQGDAATRPTALRVYDVLGRRLYDLPLDEDNLLANHPIEVSDWAAGVYFVSLFSGKRILATRKVVVAH